MTDNVVINACGRPGMATKPLQLFEEMLPHGLQPDLDTRTTVTRACEELGMPRKALQLLEEIQQQGVRRRGNGTFSNLRT